MEFVANALGKAVTKWHQGREYLVAPATTIVQGVLAGSKGPLYYPPEETHKAGPAWNKVPVVLYHPMDEAGNNVEVSYPGVKDRQVIGFTRDTKTNNGAKLQHQVWFDVKRTAAADKRFGTDVLNRLKQGHAPIGTSTGLFTEDVPAAPGANHLGRPYHFVATNHRPDHLAVLPDQVGACSINDGCGILINGKQSTNPMTHYDALGNPLTLTQNGWVALNANPEGINQYTGGVGHVTVRETYGTRTPAVKSKIRDIEQGPLSYVAGKSVSEAHEEVAKTHDLHSKSLEKLQRIAAGKEEPEHGSIEHHDWQHAQAKAGRILPSDEWAKNLAIPAKEGYLRGVKATGNAISHLARAHDKKLKAKATENAMVPPTKDQLADRIARLEILLNAREITKDEAGRFAVGGGKGTKLDPNDQDEEDDEDEDEGVQRDILGVPVGKKSTKNANPEGINQYTGHPSIDAALSHSGPLHEKVRALYDASQHYADLVEADKASAQLAEQHMRGALAGKSGSEIKEAASAVKGREFKGSIKGATDEIVGLQSRRVAAASRAKMYLPNDIIKAEAQGRLEQAGYKPTHNAEQGRHPETGVYQGMAHTAAKKGYSDTRQNPLDLDRFTDADEDAAAPIEDEDAEIGQGDRPGVTKGKDEPILNAEIATAYLTYNRDWPQAKRDALKASAPEDFAGPRSSFPIKSQSDVDSASKLIGHADNPDAVKGKIKSIAARKGLTLPSSWQSQGTSNMSPGMYGDMAPDPHQMTKQAAGATLQTEHEPAMAHAQGAMAASANDKPERAVALHQKAAMVHESAATDARKVNQPMEAADHDNAAALHRKAASMQSATCNQRRTAVGYNRAAALQQLTRNCACDKDLVALNSMSDKMLQFMVANEKAEGSNADATGSGEDNAGSSEEVQDGENKIAKGGKVKDKSPAMNAARQWLDTMPDEFKPVWNSAVEADREKRLALVERITANVGDPAAKAGMQKQFMNIQRYDIHQLRQLASLVPQPRAVQNYAAMNPYASQEAQPVYLGANGAQTIAANAQQDTDDVLDIPTLNFAAERAELAKAKTPRQAV